MQPECAFIYFLKIFYRRNFEGLFLVIKQEYILKFPMVLFGQNRERTKSSIWSKEFEIVKEAPITRQDAFQVVRKSTHRSSVTQSVSPITSRIEHTINKGNTHFIFGMVKCEKLNTYYQYLIYFGGGGGFHWKAFNRPSFLPFLNKCRVSTFLKFVR